MYEIFARLCAEKGVSMRQVSRDTGVSSATISEWKNGKYKPRPDKIKALADYLGVTVAELNGQKENVPIPEDEDELDRQLIEMLRKLDDRQTQRVLDFVAGMLSSQ